MRYKAVIETDDYKDFKFFEDGNGKYIQGIDAGAVNNEWIVLYFKECKQDSVLDKIRDEIEQIKEAEYQIYGKGSWRFVDKCLDIIDKYKAESEVRDADSD